MTAAPEPPPVWPRAWCASLNVRGGRQVEEWHVFNGVDWGFVTLDLDREWARDCASIGELRAMAIEAAALPDPGVARAR